MDRADENLTVLEREIASFLGGRPYTAVQVGDPNPLNRRYVVTAVQPVPQRLRVMVGEAPRHLRAALDLLVCQLLVKEGVTDQKRLRRSCFPIIEDLDLTDPADRTTFGKVISSRIRGVSTEASSRIESLQPCVEGNNTSAEQPRIKSQERWRTCEEACT